MTAQELAEIRARFEERGIRYQGSSLDFKALLDEVVRLQAERDAAVADIKLVWLHSDDTCALCVVCLHNKPYCHIHAAGECFHHQGRQNWQWRGVKGGWVE